MRFRYLFRLILGYLTKITIKAQNHRIIVVTGVGQTSIVKESLYTILYNKYTTRRNLEYPKSEFTIPLAIYGVHKYPKSYIEWIFVILKAFFQTKKSNSLKHVTILEIISTAESFYEYWINVLKPQNILIINQNYDLTNKKELKFLMNAIFSTHLKSFHIDENDINKEIEKLF